MCEKYFNKPLIQASACREAQLLPSSGSETWLYLESQVCVFCRCPIAPRVILSLQNSGVFWNTTVALGSVKHEGKTCVWTKQPFPACRACLPAARLSVSEEKGLAIGGWEAEAGLTLPISATHLSSVIATRANTHLVAKVSWG